MILGAIQDTQIVKSAGIAYVHYVSFMFCFAALAVERRLIKTDPNRNETISMVITDVIYGIAGIALLASGILRVLYFGQGTEFYTHNPLFWVKIGVFIFVGTLSLYPTVTYILWSIPLTKGELPDVGLKLVNRLKIILNIELVGFALIPIFATLMARGVGLN
jgi:putative membrane protein